MGCLVTLLLGILVISFSIQVPPPRNISCGSLTCHQDNSLCIKTENDYDCECSSEYDSLPDDPLKCVYLKKSKLKAFLFELLVTYGAGHFYLENYQMAIPKLLFWVLSYCLIIILRTFQKSDENNIQFSCFMKIVAGLILLIMIIWQVLDLVFIWLDYYTDGYGISLN
jgi:hypothetical protein